ncbi:MAG: iron-siderophore ABC transporter substrate-binding protein [Actinomycetota bacterium]
MSLLAACGDDDSAEPAPTDTTTGASTDVEPIATAPTTAEASDDTTSASTQPTPDESTTPTTPRTKTAPDPTTTEAGADFPRTVVDAGGPVEIPARPERIIATGAQVDLDSLVVLGIDPVGAGTFFGAPPPWVADAVDDAVLFDVNETNLEQVASLDPDLVLGPADVLEPVADELRQIAPTLLLDTATPWRQNLELIADATGREDDADEFLDDFDLLVEEMRAAAAPFAETTISAITVGPDGSVLALAARSATGEALELLGVPRADGQDADVEFVPVAEELLGDLDADVIFVWHSAFLAPQWEELQASPVWQSIPAVADGRVVVSTDERWFFATPQAVRLSVEALISDVLEPGTGRGG